MVSEQTCKIHHKWTKACDKRLNRLISNIHHTSEDKQYCHVGNTGKQCRLGLFQDSDFAGDLEDSKSTPGGTLCILGSHTFVPINFQRERKFLERLMIWIMLILFPQTRILLARKLFCISLWRQRSSDQDDHKGKKPYNETCFQNPQSCSWLVVW